MKLIAEGRAPVKPEEFGLGDAVSAVATPVARALRMPCVDPKTGKLLPASPCGKRKAVLNRFGRKVGAGIRRLVGIVRTT